MPKSWGSSFPEFREAYEEHLAYYEELLLASQSIERGWGRREIKIWHRGGRPQYGWEWPNTSM